MKENINYNVDYFIKKFEAIPEEKWGESTLEYRGRCCAYGHCELRTHLSAATKEAVALSDLFKPLEVAGENKDICYFESVSWTVVNINDGHNIKYLQPTPKQRILAALYDVRAMQQSKERIRYVAVCEELKNVDVAELCN